MKEKATRIRTFSPMDPGIPPDGSPEKPPPGTPAPPRVSDPPAETGESPSGDVPDLFFPPKRRRRPGCLGRGGCGVGCLGVMLVVLIVMGAFLAWLLGEARIPAAESLVGQETVAFTIVRLDEEDPGVRALLQHTMMQLRTAFIDRSTLPDAVKDTLHKLAPQNVHSFLPMQMVVSYDVLDTVAGPLATPAPAGSFSPAQEFPSPAPGSPSPAPGSPSPAPGSPSPAPGSPSPAPGSPSPAPGSPSPAPGSPSPAPGTPAPGPQTSSPTRSAAVPTFVVSFGRFKGLSDVMFRTIVSSREAGATLAGYRGCEILTLPARQPGDINSIGHVKNNYVFSSRVEGVKLSLDRLLSSSGTFGGRPALARLYADLDPRQDLLGVVGGEQLRRFLEDIAREQDVNQSGPRVSAAFVDEASSAVEQLGWEMDVLSQDELSVRAVLDCRTTADAERVRGFVEQMGREAKQAGLGEYTRPRVVGTRVEAAWRISSMQKIVGGMAGQSPAPRVPSPAPSPVQPGSSSSL